MALEDLDGMGWKPFDEMSSSYASGVHFKRFLEKVREGCLKDSYLYCQLHEKTNYVLLPGLVLKNDIPTPSNIRVPSSANFSIKAFDRKERELDEDIFARIDIGQDEDCRNIGYPQDTIKRLRHQAAVRLMHLLTLNLNDFYFYDLFENRVSRVDDNLIERLLIPGLDAKLEFVYVQ